MRSALVALPLALMSASLANAQTPPANQVSPGAAMLSLAAEGSVASRPDMAVASMGVQTQGQTAAAALGENSRLMNGLIAALRRAGVAERDIQTSTISVSPQYAYREGEQPRLTGYQANNQVTARVRNLDNLGRTLDAAVNAGGNTLNGVNFTFQDPDGETDRARQDAIRTARQRAELYANAAGLRVGRIVSISEGGGFAPPPMPMAMMAEGRAIAAPPPPVAPGEVETRVSVNVVFELR